MQPLDRIIVKSNDRMQRILDWYFDNRDWLDREPFCAPMESGVVELCEEKIAFTFTSKGSLVEIVIYVTTKPNLPPIVAFDYDPATKEIKNRRVAPEGSQTTIDLELINILLLSDNMCRKEAVKYHVLMLFMTFFQEKVEVKKVVESRPVTKKKRKTHHILPLIHKIYTVPEVDADFLPKKKRGYTKPDFEFTVRGHYRHYKNGKVVWICAFTKGKGRDKRGGKIYKA